MKRYLDIGLSIVIVVLVVAALLGSVYMLTNTLLDDRAVTTTMITYDGVEYKCWHYPNEMECVSVLDPDIGGGRMQE